MGAARLRRGRGALCASEGGTGPDAAVCLFAWAGGRDLRAAARRAHPGGDLPGCRHAAAHHRVAMAAEQPRRLRHALPARARGGVAGVDRQRAIQRGQRGRRRS
ncbi:hypothetical protein CEE84_12750, partial [Lactobacillus crispatus]